MEKILSGFGSLLYRMRFTMLFFYVVLPEEPLEPA